MRKSFFMSYLMLVVLPFVPPAQSAEEWVAEEIFNQLNELRRDNNQLRNELEKVKQELAQFKSAKANGKSVSKVILDDDPVMGARDAKVAIVVFTDYECPFCKRHSLQTLPQLKANYIDTGKVQYVLRDFPLSFHKKAKYAAIAANCAGEQGQYWKMHEQLFNQKAAFNKNGYLEIAKGINLNTEQFDKCLDDPKQATEVDNDVKYGEQVGVRGTPAFFIGRVENGQVIDAQFISGAQAYGRFSQVIDSILN